MEPLEHRIARLTPDQQQEVGDFVDFLLLKNNIRQGTAGTNPSLIMVNTPPVMAPDLSFSQTTDPLPGSDSWFIYDRSSSDSHREPTPPAVQEITASGDDGIPSDYVDYGKSEGQLSPATDAQKKVRHRIIAREELEKTCHILEWVD